MNVTLKSGRVLVLTASQIAANLQTTLDVAKFAHREFLQARAKYGAFSNVAETYRIQRVEHLAALARWVRPWEEIYRRNSLKYRRYFAKEAA